MARALRKTLIGAAVLLALGLAWYLTRPEPPATAPALKHSYSRALKQAHAGQPGAARVLYQQLARTDLSAARRARLYAELPNYPSGRALEFARADLRHDSQLVRNAAIDAVVGLVSASERVSLLGPLLEDGEPDTRFHVARTLLNLTPEQLGAYFTPLQATLDEYVKVLEQAHDSAPDQARLADIYIHDGDYQQAELAIRRVLAGSPGDLDALVTLAGILDKRGKPDEARETLAGPLNEHPDSAFLQHELGQWLLAHDQGEFALLALARAVELEPDTASYRYDLAVALHALDQTPAAQQQLDELVRRHPANRRARVLLIQYWKETGQLQNVQVLLAELEQQNADDPALQQGL